MKRLSFVLILLLALTGCVSVSKTVLIPDLPSVPFEDVAVYFADDEVPEHRRVAILVAEGHYTYTTEGGMYDKLRKRAGKLGANAIIVEDFRDPSGVGKVVSAVFGVGGNRKGQALAILVE